MAVLLLPPPAPVTCLGSPWGWPPVWLLHRGLCESCSLLYPNFFHMAWHKVGILQYVFRVKCDVLRASMRSGWGCRDREETREVCLWSQLLHLTLSFPFPLPPSAGHQSENRPALTRESLSLKSKARAQPRGGRRSEARQARQPSLFLDHVKMGPWPHTQARTQAAGSENSPAICINR